MSFARFLDRSRPKKHIKSNFIRIEWVPNDCIGEIPVVIDSTDFHVEYKFHSRKNPSESISFESNGHS